MLYRKISDLFITIPVFLIGSIFLILFFYTDIKMNNRSLAMSFFALYNNCPLILTAIYIWIKAVITDLVRIINHEEITIPGFVFWMYGLLYFIFWGANDLLYNGLHIQPVSPGKEYLLYKNPVVFWTVLDIIVALLFIPLNHLLNEAVLKKRKTEDRLILTLLRSMAVFILSIFISEAL